MGRRQQLGRGLASARPGLDQVVVGLGVLDQRGRGADFAGEQLRGFAASGRGRAFRQTRRLGR
jgi:hypothetical protein